MSRPHVLRQAAQAKRKDPRGQVGKPAPLREHHETAVVGDQRQPRELLLRRPANPRIARPDLERPRRPAPKRKPPLALHRDMAQRSAEQAMKRKRVMLRNQRVPTPLLRNTEHRTDRDIPQHKPVTDGS